MFLISKASGDSMESIISVLETNRRALDIEALEARGELAERCAADPPPRDGRRSRPSALRKFQYRLFRLGLPVVSQSDGLLVRMMSLGGDASDVVIALSLGALYQKSSRARRLPCSTAQRSLITPGGTPLAEQADLVPPLLVQENDYIFRFQQLHVAMLAMVVCWPPELARGHKTWAKGSCATYCWRSTATAAASIATRWAINPQRAAAINLSACCGNVPRPVWRDTDRFPDQRRAPGLNPACQDFPAITPLTTSNRHLRRQHHAFSARMCPGQKWKTGKFSTTAPLASSALNARSRVAHPAQTCILRATAPADRRRLQYSASR